VLRCVVLPDGSQLTKIWRDIRDKLHGSAIYVRDPRTLEWFGGLRKASADSTVVVIVREAFEEDADIKLALVGDGSGAGFLNLGCSKMLCTKRISRR